LDGKSSSRNQELVKLPEKQNGSSHTLSIQCVKSRWFPENSGF